MHKKNSNPVSLFSFQDIITSLTGIMIVIVLVILLQLVESASKVTESIQHHSELKLLREKILELQKKKFILNTELIQIRKGSEKLQDKLFLLSNAELHHLISSETAQLDPLRSQLKQQKTVLKSLEQRVGQHLLQKTAVQRATEKIELQIKDLQKMAEKIVELKQEKKKLNKTIRRKQRTVQFAFSGFYDRTPILVEVTAWGFRAKIHPDGKINSFGRKSEKGASPSKYIPLLKEWLGKITFSHYIVLLFRSDSLDFHDEICNSLKYKSYGRELLADREECF